MILGCLSSSLRLIDGSAIAHRLLFLSHQRITHLALYPIDQVAGFTVDVVVELKCVGVCFYFCFLPYEPAYSTFPCTFIWLVFLKQLTMFCMYKHVLQIGIPPECCDWSSWKYSLHSAGSIFTHKYIYIHTKILEVNLFAFAYRLFHRDFSLINGAYIYRYIPPCPIYPLYEAVTRICPSIWVLIF